MKNSTKKSGVAVLVTFALFATVFVLSRTDSQSSQNVATSTTQPTQQTQPTSTQDQNGNSNVQSSVSTTETLLLYLIEEEKLAHDVYTVMYQKYGANVFGNILESESTHQSRVLTLLQTYNIADPRSSELGVFKNTELQALYDALIKQGSISVTEAYKVGIVIEEKDIADITNQLATATEQDVIATLEALRSGSENHLRAFKRKV